MTTQKPHRLSFERYQQQETASKLPTHIIQNVLGIRSVPVPFLTLGVCETFTPFFSAATKNRTNTRFPPSSGPEAQQLARTNSSEQQFTPCWGKNTIDNRTITVSTSPGQESSSSSSSLGFAPCRHQLNLISSRQQHLSISLSSQSTTQFIITHSAFFIRRDSDSEL